MEISELIENINSRKNRRQLREYLRSLRFELRFNSLRELIYHVDVYLSSGNWEQADQLLAVAEKLSRYVEDDSGSRNPRDVRSLKIITQKKRAKYYDNRGERTEAAAQYRVIIKGLRMPEEETFMAEMLMELGIVEEHMGRKKEALTRFDKASRLYGTRKDSFNFKAALFNCAHVLYDLNFYSKAEEFCREVILGHEEGKKLHSPVAHSYLEMANIYEIQQKEEKARIYYQKALDCYRRLPNLLKMSDILNRIGSYEIEDGNIASAEAVFREALDIKESIDFAQGRGRYFEMMGDQLRWGNSPREALNCYNGAYQFFDEAGCESSKTIIKHKIFKVLQELGLQRKDLGTFIEKFKNKPFDPSGMEELEKIEYGRNGNDGYITPPGMPWDSPHSIRVNRRFLIYLLRNLSRASSRLGKKQDFLKYSRIRSLVEEDYKKQK